jgi:ABC-2 type transport system permease protein
MSKPGSIPWLMSHELRLFWRRGQKSSKSGWLLAGFILSIWMVVSFFMFQGLGPRLPPPPYIEGSGDGLALAAIGVAIAFIGSIMMSGAVLAAVDAIYTRNDLDLLLSSPLSAWRILAVRSIAIAINALPIYIGLLGPPLLWLSIFSSPLWLSAIVFLITLAFAATGLALLIVTGLFRLIGPKRTRVLAQIFSAVAGAAIFIGFQLLNLNRRDEGGMSQNEIARTILSMDLDPNAWWQAPARAFTGDIPSTLAWVVFVALLFPFGVYIFSRRFVSDAAAASAMGQRKRVADVRVARVRGGLMPTIIRKEIRLLTRDPLLLSQVGLQLIYFLPLAFILFRPGSTMTLDEAAFAPALTIIASTLAASLTWITVSAEDAPDLLISAPISSRLVDRAKLLAAVLPVLALMTLPLIVLWWRDPEAGAWATGGVLVASFCAATIGLWRRVPASRRDFVRRRAKGSIMAGLGQGAVTLGITSSVALGVYGLPWMAILPAIVWLAILGALYKPTPSIAT